METELWKTVWAIKGPNKLKHFVWLACKGSLAVKERLFNRHIAPDNKCTICGEVETIIHSLFFCKHAMDLWKISDFVRHIQDAPKTSFAEILLWMVGMEGCEELRHFVTLSWASWTYRNKQVF